MQLKEVLMGTSVLAVGGLAVAGIVMVARSDGRIDYCYTHATNMSGQGYEVVGHRPWRMDATIGYAPTPEAAEKVLRESGACERGKPGL